MRIRNLYFYFILLGLVTSLCLPHESSSLTETTNSFSVTRKNETLDTSFKQDAFETGDGTPRIDYTYEYYGKNGEVLASSDDYIPSIQPMYAQDKYEDNDSLSSVRYFNQGFQPSSMQSFYSFRYNISGTISKKGWWLWETPDRDFYGFHTSGSGMLTADLNSIPSNCDYDLNLYCLPNNPTSTPSQSILVDTSTNTQTIVQTEGVSKNFVEAVFAIVEVFSKNDSTWNDTDSYNLSVNFTNSNYYREPVNIQNQKNAGYWGLLWKSDFTPEGVPPCSLTSSNETVRSLSLLNPMIKSLDNSSNGEKILYAKVLVWNQQLCSALAVYYSTLASGLAKLIEQQLGNYETVSVLATLTSITVSCAGFIFAVNLPIIEEIPSLILSMIADSFIPSTTTIGSYGYYSNLAGAFGEADGENIMYIDFYYFIINGTIDWTPQFYDSSDSNAYHQHRYVLPTFSYLQDNSYFTGSIFGFASMEGLINLF